MNRVLATLALLAAGCTAESGADGPKGEATLIRTDVEAAGANCEQGGTRLSIGLDSNGDATLTDDEVSEVRYVCNGDGVPALYAVTDGAATCSAGGHTIHWGLDTDGDGSLGEHEQMGSFVVCHGATGEAGMAGSIQILEPIEAGATCAAGGYRLSFGRDTNGDGVLDAREVEGTSVLCNGVDGLASLIDHVELKAGSEHCPNGGVLFRTGLDLDGSGTLDPEEVERESAMCLPCPHPGSSNCTSGELAVSAQFNLPFMPGRLAVADLDGDGNQDILVNDYHAPEVHLLRGRGDGTFEPPTLAATGIGHAGHMALADFDGDGILDLVGGAAFVRGSGDGTFGTAVPLALGAAFIEVTSVGDDALPDLLVGSFDEVTLFESVGDGSFAPVRTFASDNAGHAIPVASGDLNGDGHLDLVWPASESHALGVEVSLNQGDGTFSDVVFSEIVAQPFTSGMTMRLGDVNRDGHLDIILFSDSAVTQMPQLHLALGDGQGSFPNVHRRAFIRFRTMEIADFNGDGFLDLALVTFGPSTMLYAGTDGTSIGDVMFEVAAGAFDLVLGDFNDDGKVDVVVSDQHGLRVTVMLGE